jgi:hypothetical protein
MKNLSIGALAVGLIALILAIVALSRIGGPEVEAKPAATPEDIARLDNELTKLRASLEENTRNQEGVASRLAGLTGKTDGLADAIDQLKTREPVTVAAAPAAAAEIDNEKLVAAVQEALPQAFRQMRERAMAQRNAGGRPQGPQQGRARVTMKDVPEAAIAAATKTVAGFKGDHAHAVGEQNGQKVFEIDGNKDGQSYQVRVTADGTVVSHSVRTRGRGRTGNNRQRGGRQNDGQRNADQPRATDEPAPLEQF